MKREWVKVNDHWHKTTDDGKYLKCGGGSIEWNGRVKAVVFSEEPPAPVCSACKPKTRYPAYESTVLH